jgi:hypothetical protein
MLFQITMKPYTGYFILIREIKLSRRQWSVASIPISNWNLRLENDYPG